MRNDEGRRPAGSERVSPAMAVPCPVALKAHFALRLLNADAIPGIESTPGDDTLDDPNFESLVAFENHGATAVGRNPINTYKWLERNN